MLYRRRGDAAVVWRLRKLQQEALEIPADGVLVGSTGVIGMQMPIEKLKKGIQILAKEKQSGAVAANAAAKAIMTTDTMEKKWQ